MVPSSRPSRRLHALETAPTADARRLERRIATLTVAGIAAVLAMYLLTEARVPHDHGDVAELLGVAFAGVGLLALAGGLAMIALVRRAARRLEGARARLRGAELALVESHERYEVAITGSRDGLWDWDLRRRRVHFSPRWKAMLGYAEHEVGSRLAEWRRLVHPDDRGRVRRAVADYLASAGDALQLEYRMRHADGSWRWVLARGTVLRDAAGRPHRMAGSHTDVTDRRADDVQRQALETQLRQAQKMEALGTLAGGIAHDFNNMLAAMLGYCELAVEDLPAESRARLDLLEALAAGSRARALVAQILAFTRQDTGRTERVVLDDVVLDTLGMLRATIPATVEIVAPERVGAEVLASPTHLQQVVVNLCTNAEHAMRGRPVRRLRVELDTVHLGPEERLPDMPPGDYARLRVRDTGCGIPPALRARIFEPFFTTKPVNQGTGMGLSVVHGIVTAAGGAVRVESVEGEGTTIDVYLPLAPGGAAQATPAGGMPDVVPPAAVQVAGRGRVLVVDDEPAIGRVVQRQLTRAGYAVTVDSDPHVALARLREAPDAFDAVITDQTMPGLTGDRFLGLAHAVRADLPIVLCTGYSQDLTPEHARRIGAAALLAKPVGSAELTATLRRVLAA